MGNKPTIGDAELSEVKRRLLDSLYRAEGTAAPAPDVIPRRPAQEEIPLSFAQEQVWIHSQIAGEVPIYNEAMTLYRHGPLDAGVLRRCLAEMVRRHEIWRTTFHAVNGRPVQVVHPAPKDFSLPEFDLRAAPADEREAQARSRAEEDARRPFDLARGPLLRAILVRKEEEEYCLYLTFHQLVFDGVTAYTVVLPELARLYEALASGQVSSLPELPIQYGDFAHWQRRTRKQDPEQMAYWQRNLGGELPVLHWPSDRARPAIETHHGDSQRLRLPQELVAGLKALGIDEGVSLYVVMLAGFAAVLQRYTQQAHILLGSLSGGRKRAELEGLAGYFVNPVALRIDLSGNPTFRELLKRVRETVLGALSHDEIPFQDVVSALKPKPDASRNPFFQVGVSLQPQAPGAFSGWDLATEEVSTGASKLDLVVVMDERPDQLFGPVTWNPDLFDADTIRRTLGHWQTLLAGALADPEQRLSDLPLLTEAERQLMLVSFNATTKDYPQETVCSLFEKQARDRADKTALVFDGRELRYGELNERANRLAHLLRRRGIGPGHFVGVCLERSLEMVVALLGVLKAGAAYVPLDPSHPIERLSFTLLDSEAKVLLTQAGLKDLSAAFAVERMFLDSDWPALAQESAENPEAGAGLDDLAYLIYTSGSTGQPKGVQISHRSLANFLFSMQSEPGISEDDTLLAVTTIAFDIAGLELYVPLSTGGRVVIAGRSDVTDGKKLAKLLRDHRVTVMQATPASWRLLIESGWNGNDGLKILCGGEALSRDLADLLLARSNSVWNLYGPTETTIWSTCARVRAGERIVPIGRPIANTQTYVLDENLQPVPVGVEGELYIGGRGLARGYMKRPELTEEKFIQHPFARGAGERLYKTGDQARYLPNGDLECLGRNDDQLKIRGFRIEPGEIEAKIREIPGIQQAVVVGREDNGGEKRLVAYVVKENGGQLDAARLRDELKKKLPVYMVPATFVALAALPLNTNGKVDRRSLPAPEKEAAIPKRGSQAPRTETEERLARIWSEILGVATIAPTDSFFDLGGHSISAVRLFAAIEKNFRVSLPISTLFSAPSLGELAALISAKNLSANWNSLVAIQPQGSRPPLFCIHGGGGNVFIYRALSQRLGLDQPLYGLQSRGLDGKQGYVIRIEDMAALYLKEVRNLQPRGPYFLTGYCMGGTVALEMAQQLCEQGETVGLLALLDTVNWSKMGVESLQSKTIRHAEKLFFHVGNFLRLNSTEKVEFFQEKLAVLRDRTPVWRGLLFRRFSSNKSGERSPASVLADIWEINHQAPINYVPRPYPGVITDFRPMKQYSEFSGPSMSWEKLAMGGQDVVILPVYPAGMLLEPFVKRLAEELKKRIERAMPAAEEVEKVTSAEIG